MLAADAELEAGLRAPPPLGGQRDQLADSVLVDRDEGVALEDSLLDIMGEEAAGVVAADSQRGLRKIVGSEAEEFGLGGDVRGAQRGPGKLDHRPHKIV